MVPVSPMRTAAIAVLAAACCLAAPPAAPAKEDVRARLDAPRALADATPGSRLRVSWTLNAAPRMPLRGRVSTAELKAGFGAGGVYIAVRGDGSPARIFPAVSPGPGYPRGRYAAHVVVPRGGVSSVAIGLDGWRYAPGQARIPADVFFPIENDPFRVAQRGSPDPSPWPWLAAGALLLAALTAGLTAAARRHPAPRPG
ncbi:MAG: hypothetical protein QOE98_132 [Gaiellaceae bacterium]|jgi:hypothetical protein|nr:hypothetical protein [Gaiellaceae bacterium]